jgi:hypothetical protein
MVIVPRTKRVAQQNKALRTPTETIQGFDIFLNIILAGIVVLGKHLRVCGTETLNDDIERAINAKASRDKVQEGAKTTYT